MVSKFARITASLAILSTLFLAGCSNSSESQEQHHTANGDLQEKTGSLSKLPSFLDQASETIRSAYVTASTVTDSLPYIPCYCGCGESAGHESNLNCFIDEIQEDGSVIWDDHGTRCGVCMEIALTTAALKEKGLSTSDIRTYIDQTYAEGYAAPTPTPMPS
ncbi:PCYCGC motif-containing (lipo)protein [Paenibacillus selenitireducens]|uniref:PCYCGC motif-containing (lipo)protein n=1 Tax=Paenibacillus selenitireducens TaxID=1324314 RepID=UPI0009969AA9|nr:PCYCGC motif-containing (lipo)protein [Paenibacillus selenitireducens]